MTTRALSGLARRELRERVLRGEKKSREPVDVIVAERFGQNARGDETVRQRVARAGGNLRAVGNHPPASVGRTRQVGGVEMQKGVAGHVDAVAGPQKIRLGENQRRRKPARTDEFLRAVAVGENFVQQRGALDQTGFERAPFVRRDDERNRVELPRTFHAARVAIDVVGDALLVDEPLAGVRAPRQFRRAEFLQFAEQLRVVRKHFAVRREQFIKRARAALVTGQQLSGGAAFLAKLVSSVTD